MALVISVEFMSAPAIVVDLRARTSWPARAARAHRRELRLQSAGRERSPLIETRYAPNTTRTTTKLIQALFRGRTRGHLTLQREGGSRGLCLSISGLAAVTVP